MNLVGLLAGDLVSNAASVVADKFIDKLMPSKAPEFLEKLKLVQEQEAHKLSLEDLELSREEEMALIEMREDAMTKGIESMEIEINGSRYVMEVGAFSFVPQV
ncbi:MAG: hypothetical protein OXU45_02125 [Candidatus Melainabacteria bacterium]|nr:hypothetical protein [Candidatus Melainabacteria bacterium]